MDCYCRQADRFCGCGSWGVLENYLLYLGMEKLKCENGLILNLPYSDLSDTARASSPFRNDGEMDDDGIVTIELVKRIDDTTSVSSFSTIDLREVEKSWEDHFEKQKPISINEEKNKPIG